MTMTRKTSLIALGATLIVFGVANILFSVPQPLVVTWTNPTTNDHAAQTPLTDLAGILVCISTSPLPGGTPGDLAADCPQLEDIKAANIEQWAGDFEVPVKTTGTVYVRALAYDTSGNISDYSDEASVGYDKLPPSQPIITQIMLTIINNIITGQ